MKPQIKFVYTTFSTPPPPPPPYMLFGHLQGVPHLRCTGSFASPPSIVLVICKVHPPLHHIGHQHAPPLCVVLGHSEAPPPLCRIGSFGSPPPLCIILGHIQGHPIFAPYCSPLSFVSEWRIALSARNHFPPHPPPAERLIKLHCTS